MASEHIPTSVARFLSLTCDDTGLQLAIRDYGEDDKVAQMTAIKDLHNALTVVTMQWDKVFNAHDETEISMDDLMDMEIKIKYQMDILLEDLYIVKEKQKSFLTSI